MHSLLLVLRALCLHLSLQAWFRRQTDVPNSRSMTGLTRWVNGLNVRTGNQENVTACTEFMQMLARFAASDPENVPQHIQAAILEVKDSPGATLALHLPTSPSPCLYCTCCLHLSVWLARLCLPRCRREGSAACSQLFFRESWRSYV